MGTTPSSQLTVIEELIRKKIRFDEGVVRRLAVHDTALCILGAALVTLTPLAASFMHNLNKEFRELSKATLLLEHRFNYYERVNSAATVDQLGGDSWLTPVELPAACVYNRIALEEQYKQSFLHSDG